MDIWVAIEKDNPLKLQQILDGKRIDPDAPVDVSVSCNNSHCHILVLL